MILLAKSSVDEQMYHHGHHQVTVGKATRGPVLFTMARAIAATRPPSHR